MSDREAAIRERLRQFVPDGYRDEDGVWHEGPHRSESLAALDGLLAELAAARETAEQERRHLRAVQSELAAAREEHDRAGASWDRELVRRTRERDQAREREAKLRGALRDVDTIITDQRLRAISPYVADKVRAALADGEGETTGKVGTPSDD